MQGSGWKLSGGKTKEVKRKDENRKKKKQEHLTPQNTHPHSNTVRPH